MFLVFSPRGLSIPPPRFPKIFLNIFQFKFTKWAYISADTKCFSKNNSNVTHLLYLLYFQISIWLVSFYLCTSDPISKNIHHPCTTLKPCIYTMSSKFDHDKSRFRYYAMLRLKCTFAFPTRFCP